MIDIFVDSQKGSERKLKQKSAHNHISSINSAEKEDIYQFGLILLELITGKVVTSSMEVEVLKYEVYNIYINMI